MSELIVPGSWKCDKCGFQLMKRVLSMAAGTVGTDYSTAIEPCPNDGTKMRAYTWKEEAQDCYAAMDRQFEALEKYEALVKEISAITADQSQPLGNRLQMIRARANLALSKGLLLNL